MNIFNTSQILTAAATCNMSIELSSSPDAHDTGAWPKQTTSISMKINTYLRLPLQNLHPKLASFPLPQPQSTFFSSSSSLEFISHTASIRKDWLLFGFMFIFTDIVAHMGDARWCSPR